MVKRNAQALSSIFGRCVCTFGQFAEYISHCRVAAVRTGNDSSGTELLGEEQSRLILMANFADKHLQYCFHDCEPRSVAGTSPLFVSEQRLSSSNSLELMEV